MNKLRAPSHPDIEAIQHAIETARSMPHWYGGRVSINTRVDLLDALLDLTDEARSFAAAHDGHDDECDRCRFARLVQTIDALTERP